MTHVVTNACINCRYTDCVAVCPVDCFRAGPNFLVIDPDECIDCAVCVPECPEEAIYARDDLPADLVRFVEINASLSQQWPGISSKAEPFPEAEKWKGVSDKLDQLKLSN